MRPVLRSVAALGLMLVIYYAVPVGRLSSTASAVLSVGSLVVGGTVLAWLITGQVRHHLRAGAEDDDVRVQSLVMLLYLAVLLFALGYYSLARSTDQFHGLETRTDALYFTVTTLSTVGFGDIHAAGQAARALVTAQIVFNLVFIGALVSLLSRRLRQRAASRPSPDGDAGA